LPFTRKIRSELFGPQHKGSIFRTVIVLFYADDVDGCVNKAGALRGLRKMEIGKERVRPQRRNDTAGTSFSFSYFQFRPHTSTCLSCTYMCGRWDIFSLALCGNPPWIHIRKYAFPLFLRCHPHEMTGAQLGKEREKAVQNFHLVLHLEMPAIYSTANARGTTRRMQDFEIAPSN
jgi:hypothetical protein